MVYDDVIVISGNDHKSLQCFIDKLNSQFALKDMGELHNLLGIEVRRCESGLHLTKVKYIKELLKRFNFEHLKPCATLMTVGKIISKNEREKMVDPFFFRSAIPCSYTARN